MAFCACSSCAPSPAVSRRQFLCTTAASAAAASTVASAIVGTARAQQPGGATAPGRAILIKGGCVLTLDRAVGDFEQADVLVEGGKISAVRPNISAPNAEVIDAARMIVMPGHRRYPSPHVAGHPAQRAARRLARGLPQRRAADVRREV